MAEFDKDEQLGKPGYIPLIKLAGASMAVGGTVGIAFLAGMYQTAAPLSQVLIACTSLAAGLGSLTIKFKKD